MAGMASTNVIISGIFGAILVVYLIANTFNDIGDEIAGVNESHKGGTILKLLPLFLAFGVVVGVYYMFSKKGK